MGTPTMEELLALAGAHGLGLVAEGARVDTSGLDFVALHARDDAGGAWIVRAPRRASVVARAWVEAAALRLVAGRLPVAVPDWRVHSEALIAYPRLAGEPAWEITAELGVTWALRTPEAPSEAFVVGFAGFLAALWSVPVEAARVAGLPVRTSGEARAELAAQLQVVLAHHAVSERVLARWRRLVDERAWPEEVCLIHGDLHPGHLLIDADERIIGVLDWTEAQVGDPAVDLTFILLCFGEATLDRVLAALAALGCEVGPAFRAHVIERAAASPITMLHWAIMEGNAVPVAPAMAMIAAQEEALAAESSP